MRRLCYHKQLQFSNVVYEKQPSVGFFVFYHGQTVNKNKPIIPFLKDRAEPRAVAQQLRALATLQGERQLLRTSIRQLRAIPV